MEITTIMVTMELTTETVPYGAIENFEDAKLLAMIYVHNFQLVATE